MIDTTGSKRGTSKKSRASAKGASVGRVHRKVLFNGIHSVSSPPIDLRAQTESTERKKRNEFRSTKK